MNAALFITIWLALVAFVAAEAGRRTALSGRTPPPWLTPVSYTGLTLLVIHIAIAFGVRHAWSHDAAWHATAAQTAAVYGLNWGGGVYVNYLFALVWAIDAWLWQKSPDRAAGRPPALRWMLRLFYGVIILNAAVIFAQGHRRVWGLWIVIALLVIWRPLSQRPRSAA